MTFPTFLTFKQTTSIIQNYNWIRNFNFKRGQVIFNDPHNSKVKIFESKFLPVMKFKKNEKKTKSKIIKIYF